MVLFLKQTVLGQAGYCSPSALGRGTVGLDLTTGSSLVNTGDRVQGEYFGLASDNQKL